MLPVRKGLLGLYPLSLVTASIKPRPEVSNSRIILRDE
jgi:hypothetical protein